MRLFVILSGAVLLLALVAFSAYLLLQACGVRLPLTDRVISICPPDARVSAEERLDTLTEANEDLRQSILFLERELARLQCTASYPEPVTPELPPQRDALDEEAWQNRDLAVMDGCWELDSDYATTNIRTGVVTNYTEWTMCFDANGAGREEMKATDGTTCQGTLTGRFTDAGSLRIEEPGNLPCSNNTTIFRRELECSLTADRTASCVVRQPEQNRTSTVALRRARGTP